jgi:hypothetical protein
MANTSYNFNIEFQYFDGGVWNTVATVLHNTLSASNIVVDFSGYPISGSDKVERLFVTNFASNTCSGSQYNENLINNVGYTISGNNLTFVTGENYKYYDPTGCQDVYSLISYESYSYTTIVWVRPDTVKSSYLSCAFPQITASGVIKTPNKVTLSAALQQMTATGAIKTPNKVTLSAALQQMTFSGEIKTPINVTVSASFPEMTASGRLKKQNNIRINVLLSTYVSPSIFIDFKSSYENSVLFEIAHGIPYDQRALYFFAPIFKYKIPEILQKSTADAWEFWRAGNAAFQSVRSPFSRLADQDALMFNRTRSVYEAAQILRLPMLSRYWQPVVVENVSLSHYDTSTIVYSGIVVPADFRSETVSATVSSYGESDIVGSYRSFGYVGRALVDAPITSHYYAVERVGVEYLSPYDLLTKNKASVNYTIPTAFVADHQFLIVNPQPASIVTTFGTIDPLRLQVSTSMGENAWQVSASVSFEESAKARINGDAIVNVAGIALDAYFVAKNTRKTAVSKQIDVELYTTQRKLKSSPLDDNYATSKALFDAADVQAYYSIPTSSITLTNVDKTSVMTAVAGVASDIGAALAMRGNDLVVIPIDRPSGVVWQLNDDDLLELNETFIDGVGYNAIIVSDAGDSNGSINTEIEAVGDHWMLYVYGVTTATVSHTQIDAYVSIASLGAVTLTKSEQVEFKEGTATVAKPINSIASINYLSDSLSESVFSGNRIIAGGADDYALANVTYTTKPLAFRVVYNKAEALQLVIEGE